jgi:hypothetical protein
VRRNDSSVWPNRLQVVRDVCCAIFKPCKNAAGAAPAADITADDGIFTFPRFVNANEHCGRYSLASKSCSKMLRQREIKKYRIKYPQSEAEKHAFRAIVEKHRSFAAQQQQRQRH